MDWVLIMIYAYVIAYFSIVALFAGYAHHKFWPAAVVVLGALFWPIMIPIVGAFNLGVKISEIF